MKREVIAGAVVGSIFAAACSPTELPAIPPPDEDAMPNTKELQMRQTFEEVKSYWAGQKVGTPKVSLHYLTGTENRDCYVGQDVTITIRADEATDTGMSYCAFSDEILMSEATVNRLDEIIADSEIPKTDAIDIIIAHEYGHALQDAAAHRKTSLTRFELTADCYAGAALSAIGSTALKSASALYEVITPQPPGTDHGTADDRVEAYVDGKHGAICTNKR